MTSPKCQQCGKELICSECNNQVSGMMKILMAVMYKGYHLYVRSLGKTTFLWDVVIENQLYSSYIQITPKKGRQKLTKAEISEVTKICYAGGAATIDNHLGLEPADTDQKMIEMFEAARLQTTQSEVIN